MLHGERVFVLRFEGGGELGFEWMKGIPGGGTEGGMPGEGDLKDTHGQQMKHDFFTNVTPPLCSFPLSSPLETYIILTVGLAEFPRKFFKTSLDYLRFT